MGKIAIALVIFAAASFLGCRTSVTSLDTPPPSGAVRATVNEISPSEAAPRTAAAYSQFIDVRTPEEYAAGHAYRTRNIPLDSLGSNLDKIEKNEPVYLICATGRRSRKAAQALVDAGFPYVFNVTGGTEAWKTAGLPMGE